MQAKLNILLLLAIAGGLLTAGCASPGQPGAGNATGVINASKSTLNASEDLYVSGYYDGFWHHANATVLFYNATSLWNDGDYAGAAGLMGQARDEYAQAGGHYHDMAAYAGSEDELKFAESMEEAVITMDEALARYKMSIDQTLAGNDTASLEYFQEGQAMVDRSSEALSTSFSLMPPSLGGAGAPPEAG